MQPYGRDQKGAFMDRRIQRTRNSLFSAFIELRAVKPVEKITVKEMGQKLHLDSGTHRESQHQQADLLSPFSGYI